MYKRQVPSSASCANMRIPDFIVKRLGGHDGPLPILKCEMSVFDRPSWCAEVGLRPRQNCSDRAEKALRQAAAVSLIKDSFHAQ